MSNSKEKYFWGQKQQKKGKNMAKKFGMDIFCTKKIFSCELIILYSTIYALNSG
jgi:hypothetical protein